MKRLGIALHQERWTWAIVERTWRRARVLEVGEVEPGGWAGLPRARIRRIGIALSDRDVVLRRLQVGHPPESREALRQLVRWRLREDLPFEARSAVIDAALSGGTAFALAAPRDRIAEVEAATATLGVVVDTVSCESLAAFNFLDPDGRSNAVIVHDGGYADVVFDGGALSSFTLRDGTPSASVAVDTRTCGRAACERADWSAIPADHRGRFAAAIGVGS